LQFDAQIRKEEKKEEEEDERGDILGARVNCTKF
jgi:hypothetical protein